MMTWCGCVGIVEDDERKLKYFVLFTFYLLIADCVKVKKRSMTLTEILNVGSFGQIIKAYKQPLKGSLCRYHQ